MLIPTSIMTKFQGNSTTIDSTTKRNVGTKNESFDDINLRPTKQPRKKFNFNPSCLPSTGLSSREDPSNVAASIGRDMLMTLPTLKNGAIYHEADVVNDLSRQPRRRSSRRSAQSKEKPAMRKHGSILGRSRDSFLVKLMEGASIE